MKKIVALVLSVLMMLSLAACVEVAEHPTTEAAVLPVNSLEILENIWNAYAAEEKFYAMGGDSSAEKMPVENAPGAFDINNTDALTYMLLVPAEQFGKFDDAASLMHAMNANNFTCGVFHVTADAEAFATAMYEAVQGNPWMCGFPETVLVYTVGGEYVLCAFGVNEAIEPFRGKLMGAYPNAVAVYDEPLA